MYEYMFYTLSWFINCIMHNVYISSHCIWSSLMYFCFQQFKRNMKSSNNTYNLYLLYMTEISNEKEALSSIPNVYLNKIINVVLTLFAFVLLIPSFSSHMQLLGLQNNNPHLLKTTLEKQRFYWNWKQNGFTMNISKEGFLPLNMNYDHDHFEISVHTSTQM